MLDFRLAENKNLVHSFGAAIGEEILIGRGLDPGAQDCALLLRREGALQKLLIQPLPQRSAFPVGINVQLLIGTNRNDFVRLRKPNTKAIVCTHASNLTGNIVDLKRIPHDGILLIADASQTAGAVFIDMEELGIDILCFTGHKSLMGPQGTGGLCVREGVEIRPFKRGGSGIHSYDRHQPEEMPTRLEAGTLNSHAIAGLSAAIDYLNEIGLETVSKKEIALARLFYDGVKEIDGVTVYGDFSDWNRAAIVTLNIRDWDSAVTADELSENYGVAVRAGAHCAPRMHEALGTAEQGAVRFSFSWFNTEEEVRKAIEAVKELAE